MHELQGREFFQLQERLENCFCVFDGHILKRQAKVLKPSEVCDVSDHLSGRCVHTEA